MMTERKRPDRITATGPRRNQQAISGTARPEDRNTTPIKSNRSGVVLAKIERTNGAAIKVETHPVTGGVRLAMMSRCRDGSRRTMVYVFVNPAELAQVAEAFRRAAEDSQRRDGRP